MAKQLQVFRISMGWTITVLQRSSGTSTRRRNYCPLAVSFIHTNSSQLFLKSCYYNGHSHGHGGLEFNNKKNIRLASNNSQFKERLEKGEHLKVQPFLRQITDADVEKILDRSKLEQDDSRSTFYFLTKLFKPKNGQTIEEYIVNSFPESIQPYLKLSRMHKPIGTWLLFWPCTWGLALAATSEAPLPSLTMFSLFGLGAFIMRGAGCTINDLWDKNIDSKVKRTVDRPLASGQLRSRHAVAWLASQLSISLGILCQLPEPCFVIGVGSLGLVVLYPLAKRVTNWPQGVLGLTFNTGILMGYTAAVAARTAELNYLSLPWLDPSCLALYLAGISWTLIYDTIYAHQDREEDTLLGLGSTAKLFGTNSKYWLSGFSISMLSSLSAVGYLEGLNWPYFAGIAATSLHLFWQIKTLDINNNKNCAHKFISNRHIGWIIFLSLLAGH